MPGMPIERLEVRAAIIPTDRPESDGTLAWDRTTIVLVQAHAGGEVGLGWTYADEATARLVATTLVPHLVGHEAFDVEGAYARSWASIRNLGRSGIGAMAVSAVDAALWELKARLLRLPLFRLLGAAREVAEAYGSGGFTSYSHAELEAQLRGFAEAGLASVKMKVGREPHLDAERVKLARGAIGPRTQLFVDANGAYSCRQALALSSRFAEQGVVWFEEPVWAGDHTGLRRVRDRAPLGMEIAAGEYAYLPSDFRGLLEHGAVDVIQADATRCGGPTGFMRAAALCDAFDAPLSAHCAPQLHAHLCCAASRARHLEYFHDHARIERLLFDGVLSPVHGVLRPDPARPGLGVSVSWAAFERHEVRI